MRFDLFKIGGYQCTDCNNDLKTNNLNIHSWFVYCEDCYWAKVDKGEIVPPSHAKRKDKAK